MKISVLDRNAPAYEAKSSVPLFSWDCEVAAILEKYPVEDNQGKIIFYGASNFRLWERMEEDLPYRIQNHGFGGSTDKELMENADRLVFPYTPKIVVFQTGSNDYMDTQGTIEETVERCMTFKKELFTAIHKSLPEAILVVMSGLLLPGRTQYTELSQQINTRLKAFCNKQNHLYFVDSTPMTYRGGIYATELFQDDGIHLNHKGQLLWAHDYIIPRLEQIIVRMGLEDLRK